MVMNHHSFVLNGMGTARPRRASGRHYLQMIGRAKRMLMVCPLSTVRFTWEREIFNTLPHMRVEVLTGLAERRRKRLANDADIYIVNHDGLKILYEQIRRRPDIDVICYDEVATYRNSLADKSKAARSLSTSRKFVWGMTGPPTPSAPTDAVGLARLIVPETAPRSFRTSG
jgi:hypothetical protein